jgi:HAD superfamily hydrolase (TIGR01509 family)
MSHVKAVLFDMDGVVIDTQQSVTDFWLAFAAEQDVTLTADDFENHIYGVPVAHTLRVLFPDLPPAGHAALRERTAAYESGLAYTEVPGLTAFLRSLSGAGVPTALVTSGEPWKVEAMSGQLGLERLFDVVVTAADIRRGKPDPEGYALAAARLGIPPNRCVVFEDSVSGVQAAVAAGALCVGVQPSGRLAQRLFACGAWHIIPDFVRVRRLEGQPGAAPLTRWALGLEGGPHLVIKRKGAS